MKKIIVGLIMFFAAGIAIYTVAFWEPSNNLNSKKEKVGEVQDNNIDNGSELDNSNVESGFNESDLDVQMVENKKSLFKIEVEKIDEYLPKESSIKLQNIIKNLSTTDICKIEDYLKASDKEDGTKKVISLLNKRLSTERYGEVKEILEPFIDFSIIAEKV